MVKGLCPRSGDWVDLAVSLDLSKARRVLQDQKRVNVVRYYAAGAKASAIPCAQAKPLAQAH